MRTRKRHRTVSTVLFNRADFEASYSGGPIDAAALSAVLHAQTGRVPSPLEVELLLLDLQQFDERSAGTQTAFEAYMKSIWGESYCIVGADGPDKQSCAAPRSAVSEDLRRAEQDRLEFLRLLEVRH